MLHSAVGSDCLPFSLHFVLHLRSKHLHGVAVTERVSIHFGVETTETHAAAALKRPFSADVIQSAYHTFPPATLSFYHSHVTASTPTPGKHPL